jgi:hypothetical protein
MRIIVDGGAAAARVAITSTWQVCVYDRVKTTRTCLKMCLDRPIGVAGPTPVLIYYV